MDEEAKKYIKEYTDEIRKNIPKGGTIFGYPFDPNDPDQILLIAVSMAEQRIREQAAHERDFLFRVLNA